LGNFFSYGLFGVLCTQLYLYHKNFHQDRIFFRVLVWSIFVVDIILTVLSTIAAWNTLAKGWGNPLVLAPLDTVYEGMPLLSGLVASCVHFFFCWRIWKLCRIRSIPCLIMMTSLLSWGMAGFCGIHGRQLGILKLESLTPFVIVWLGGSTFCDMVITVTMVTILFRARSRTIFKEAASITTRFIQLTVETGMATAAGALSELILFATFQGKNMHFLPFLMLSKLYSNTLLTTLNARCSHDGRQATDIETSPLWFHSPDTTALDTIDGDEGQTNVPPMRVSRWDKYRSHASQSIDNISMTEIHHEPEGEIAKPLPLSTDFADPIVAKPVFHNYNPEKISLDNSTETEREL